MKAGGARSKGARGERLFRDLLIAMGYPSADRNAQQYKGGSDKCPDVTCDELSGVHFEVKFVESLNVRKALDQAIGDAGATKMPVVAHKISNRPWYFYLPANVFFQLLKLAYPCPTPTEN